MGGGSGNEFLIGLISAGFCILFRFGHLYIFQCVSIILKATRSPMMRPDFFEGTCPAQ